MLLNAVHLSLNSDTFIAPQLQQQPSGDFVPVKLALVDNNAPYVTAYIGGVRYTESRVKLVGVLKICGQPYVVVSEMQTSVLL